MSYSCSASFKKIPNDIDAMCKFITQLKKYASKEEVANEIVEYYKHWCPITKVNSLKMKRADAYDLPELESWITELFTFKWKLLKYKNETLLCMLGVPVQLQKMFDCTEYFQNSTDQDYEREEWGIDTFTRIYDKWQNKPIDAVADYAFFDEDIEDMYSYYRRCAAYQEIATPVENLLYDNKTSYIQLFNSYNDISILRMYKLICVHLSGLQFKES